MTPATPYLPRIVILTAAYPFNGGEHFLESESLHWAGFEASVSVLPATAVGPARPLPDDVEVDLTLASTRTYRAKVLAMVGAPFTGAFRHELCFLRRSRRLSRSTVTEALRTVAQARLTAKALRIVRRQRGRPIELVYAYWSDTEAYGAVLAKRKGDVQKVVSRAHGFDLFEERRRGNHMPLMREFLPEIDQVCCNSEFSYHYLAERYQVPSDRNMLAKVGVRIPNELSRPASLSECRLVSISYCVGVKRIDKIVDAVRLVASQRPDLAVTWTHLGGGPLLEDLRQYADEQLSDVANASFSFTGTLPNESVLQFLLQEPVDLMVHASDSEGLGVSMMEAMSVGIPVVAPAVGGVPEVVSNFGYLLPPHAPAQEIARAVVQILADAKGTELRLAARRHVEISGDSEKLYPEFVARVRKFIKN